jgi:plastocyanin
LTIPRPLQRNTLIRKGRGIVSTNAAPPIDRAVPGERSDGPGRVVSRSTFLALTLVSLADAATIRIEIDDGTTALRHAVASLHSESASAALSVGEALMDQRDSQFDPHVLAVTVGTRVSFPNSDKVRHHVYSFSPAKRFELPLFGGRAAAPIEFDLPGVATLGCNIHDWMVAYIVVLDTPYFALSDESGVAVIEAPEGDYELRIWYEALAPDAPEFVQSVSIDGEDGGDVVRVSLSTDASLLLPGRRDPARPTSGGAGG